MQAGRQVRIGSLLTPEAKSVTEAAELTVARIAEDRQAEIEEQ